MGTTADVMDLLTPSARKTLQSLPGGEDLTGDKAEMQVGGTKGTPPQAVAPDKSAQQPAAQADKGGQPQSSVANPLEVTEEQYNKLPSGSAYRVPGNPTVMFKP